MFKKPIKVGAQNQLSGKDRKTMKTKLNSLFNEKCVETIFNNNEKILSIKVSGSKMVLYNGDQYPLFVDGTGKNDYFPSVYTCQAYQTLLPFIHLNEGVETYIFNGANLMWPGVSSYADLGQFKKDQVIGIMNAKEQVVAIGAMGCSLEQFQKTQDKTGIAAYILHYKRDKLWDQGSKMTPQIIIPLQKKKQVPQEKVQEVKQKEPEKSQKQVQEKPIQEKQEKKAQNKVQQKNQSSEQEIQQQLHKNKKKGKKNQKTQKESKKQQIKKKASSEQQEDDDTNDADFMVMLHGSKKNPPPKVEIKKNAQFDDDQDWDKKKKKQKGGRKKPKKHEEQEKPKKQTKKGQDEESGEQGQQQQTEQSTISNKIMDNYLKQSFLNVLKLSKIEGQLPIDSGRFYMDYMLLARPQGVKLQIKQSSYKKISKFYEEMAKQKFIEFKHGKQKKGQQGSTISKILYDNQQLKNFVPTVRKLGEKDVEVKEEDHSKVKLKLTRTLVVENVYKPKQQLFDKIFKKPVNFNENWDEDAPQKKQEPDYLDETQMKAGINKYIETIIENKADNKADNKKQKKFEKQILIDYKKNPYIQELLKKQIQDYEENLAAQEEAEEMIANSDDEDKTKKKKNKKKQILKMDRETLVNKLMKQSTSYHHVYDKENGMDIFKEGQFKGINIIAEKANNKNITKITGLETFIVPKQQADKQINAMASMFQQKFASSVNVLNLPGKNLGKEIIIHGAFIDQLEEYFINEHGIKKEYISTQNKLDKKKKK